MRSWKTRLLMLFTVVAMLIAVSVPALADDDGCIGVGDGFDCIGVSTFDGFSDNCVDDFGNNVCDNFGDNCFDEFGNSDSNCDNFDTFDSQGFDTISVGDLECLTEDGDVDFCVDENGDVVNV